jgi:hypothetical protein
MMTNDDFLSLPSSDLKEYQRVKPKHPLQNRIKPTAIGTKPSMALPRPASHFSRQGVAAG